VHRELGPGLLESAYEACLLHELVLRGHSVTRQVELPVVYKGLRIDAGFRIDLLIDDTVVVECKAVERLMPIHEAQVLTYLRLSGKPIGLLINFHVPRLIDGVKRLILTPTPPSVSSATSVVNQGS
jgi:GxxExxY protein